MQALHALLRNDQQFAHLHTRFPVGSCNVRLHHYSLTDAEWLLWNGTGRATLGSENRGEIAPTIPVQQIVNDREARRLDEARRRDHIIRRGAGPKHAALILVNVCGAVRPITLGTVIARFHSIDQDRRTLDPDQGFLPAYSYIWQRSREREPVCETGICELRQGESRLIWPRPQAMKP